MAVLTSRGPGRVTAAALAWTVGPGDWIGTYVVLGKSWAQFDLDQTFGVGCTASSRSSCVFCVAVGGGQ